MGKQGNRSQRGRGEIYDEPKTEQVTLLLTRTGRSRLDVLAKSHGLSRSELIEQIARGQFQLVARSWFSNPSRWKQVIFTLSRSYIPPNP
jgi:hypothetical protein